MKYVFIENYRAEFSIKAVCRVLRVARSGWYAWCLRRHQPNRRQQFRLVCDAAVRQAFSNAKQRYGAPRLADELPRYNIKTIAASLSRQGLRAKAARKFSPVSYRGQATSRTFGPMKAACTWRWSSTCGYRLVDDGTTCLRCTANGALAA